MEHPAGTKVTLRSLAAACVLLAITLFPAGATAGRVHPNLESRLATLQNGELVPVIVELESQANPHAAAASAPRGNRGARGRAVVEALRDIASRSQPPVRALLAREEAAGAARNVMSFWIFNGFAVTASQPLVRALAARSDVREVRLDRAIPRPVPRPTADATIAAAEPVWNIAQIRAPEVWALNAQYNGAGTVVGSFDTGVDGDHPDLAPRYRGNHAISWFDPYGQHATPVDNHGHGTHTTGTAVGGDASGYAIGVAPGARWIAAKAWNDAGQGVVSRFHQIFEWFLAPGGDPANAPDVVNSSWGLTPAECYTDFQAGVQAFRAAGIVPVFASGNEGPDPATTLSPGSYAESFTVGATDFFDDIADFSSRGPSACDGGIKPNISAPGVAILSALPGGLHFELDGTSMAAPHVSGAAAVLRSISPGLTVEEIEAALVDGAVDLGAPGADNDFGVGRLDLFESARIVLGLSVVGIVATTPSAFEAGAVPGTFTITRKGSTADPLTLPYAVSGTAVPGTDYSALAGSVTIPAGVTSVSFPVVPIDDPIVERDETVIVTLDANPAYLLNPAQATVTIVSDEVPPDLVVASLAAPSATGAGDVISITDSTRNVGAVPAGASVTTLHLSINATLDAGDVLLGTRAIAALAAGASDTGSTGVTIPAGTPAGNYWILAAADNGDALVESQEGNNVLARAIAIGPDLVVSGLAGPSDSGAGQPITLTVTTRNQGAGTAAATATAFYLSTDTVLDAADILLGSRAVAALGPGASDAGPTTLSVPAGIASGNYYLFARADAGEVVSEIFETNNHVYGGSIRIGPDLIVASLNAPAAAGAGSAITVTATTRNAGGGPAGATTTRIYLSNNPVLDAGDALLGSRAVAALGAGISDTGSVSATIPAGTPAGSYWIVAKADADDALVETQESNNVLVRAITIGADLVVSALTGPSDSGAGQAITLSVTTRNQGAAAAGASATTLYLSADAMLDAADAVLGSRAVPALGAGASDTGAVAVTIPAGTVAGIYYLFARADANDAVVEITESNNTTAVILRVGPDLVVTSLNAPTAAGAGSAITVSDTTRNAGGGAAGATTTRIYLSTNTALDAGDVSLGSRAIGALVAGASNTGSVSVTIPAGTAAGTYYLVAIADGDNAVSEPQEGNNALVRAITIGSDLVVSAFTVPADSGAGTAVILTDTTRNQGAAAVGASTTAYYLSSDSVLDAADLMLGSRVVPALGAGATNAGATSVTIPAGTTPGTYYVFARADAGDVVAETFETNNTAYTTMRVGPDLMVASPTAPATTGAGSAISISDTTRNAGGGASGATTTGIYLSTDPLLDASDVLLGSRVVAALAAGASSSGSVSATIPAGTAAGTYWILARVDADDLVVESQESNNVAARSITIGADLVIAGLTAPAYGGAGGAITVTDTTRNLGSSPAGASVTAYYLSANTVLDAADIALGSRAVAALGPGASDTGSMSLTVPAGTVAGIYYLLVRADASDAVVETAETNNTTVWTLRVGPDLVVASLSAPTAAGAGSAITVTDATRNAGGGAAGATTTRIHLSTNTVLDPADVPLGSRAVAALGAGASDTGSVSATIPGSTAAGAYYLIASADSDDSVVESQEGNNVLVRAITIGADLVVTGFTTPSDAGAGQAITVTDTTRNQGAAVAGASATTYYLSTDAVLDASDIVLGSRAVPALGPGASDTGSVTVTVPAGTPPGTYYRFARADTGDAVAETFETNNALYGGVMRVGPDLLVMSVNAPTTAGAGSAITVTDTTRNTGGGTASATTTRIHLSTNTLLDAGDLLLGSRAVSFLAAGASDTGSLVVTIPAGIAAGLYYLIVEADGEGVLAELTETNNRTTRSIQVTAP